VFRDRAVPFDDTVPLRVTETCCCCWAIAAPLLGSQGFCMIGCPIVLGPGVPYEALGAYEDAGTVEGRALERWYAAAGTVVDTSYG